MIGSSFLLFASCIYTPQLHNGYNGWMRRSDVTRQLVDIAVTRQLPLPYNVLEAPFFPGEGSPIMERMTTSVISQFHGFRMLTS